MIRELQLRYARMSTLSDIDRFDDLKNYLLRRPLVRPHTTPSPPEGEGEGEGALLMNSFVCRE